MPIKPTLLKKRSVARSRLFEVEALDLQFSNGATRTYERLAPKRHGAVMVIALQDADTVLLIREYAAGFDDYLLTLPKGLIDPGETASEAANRELKEETGFGARQIRPIKSLTTSPNYMSHRIEVLVAEELYPERLPGDEPEELEVVPCPISELPLLMASAELEEARVIAALMLWLHQERPEVLCR
ncbi:ADP compounds hydrolase NudE [Motiliproteus sediminis]|uniref:ADP compounds hydrolase NudE n=1 Tax=Motiliproteus sediminis TaxID=1468178 RepID=UPI001AEFD371|nr:ADP compounds hydrolase NudE [Motiliproteus sediminis]